MLILLAEKYLCGAALELRCRGLMIPSVKRTSVIMGCSKVRDYGSSFPVRYIPKNSPKIEKLQTSSPPMDEFKKKDKNNRSNQNVLRVDYSEGGKMLERIHALDDKLNENRRPSNNLTFNVEPDVEGEIDSKLKIDDYVFWEDTQICAQDHDMPQGKDATEQKGKHVDKLNHQSTSDNLILNVEPEVEEEIESKLKIDGYICQKDTGKHEQEHGVHQQKDSIKQKGKHSMHQGRSYALDDKLNQIQNKKPSNNFNFNVGPEVEEEIDHKWGVDGYEFLEVPEESEQEDGIHQLNDAVEQRALQPGKIKQDAENLAIELLGARSYTRVELRKKLLTKKFPPQAVDAVIANFQTRGFINDFLYAETFSRSRFSSSSWGPRRIKQALFRKGVDEVDAEKAINLVFKEDESGDYHEPRLGLSKLSLDHVYAQASKQWLRGQDVPSDKRKSRMIQWLQYRGFNWGVINFVLKKLESKYPP